MLSYLSCVIINPAREEIMFVFFLVGASVLIELKILNINLMADQSFRVFYNMNDKTQSIDFSIPNNKITEDNKNESAHNLIKEKHPDFTGKNVVISKVDVFNS